MKKNEPYRFVSALMEHQVAGLIDTKTKREPAGVQHIVEKVGNTIQGQTLCGNTLEQVRDVTGAKATTMYMKRDPNRPVCPTCLKKYIDRPNAQFAHWVRGDAKV